MWVDPNTNRGFIQRKKTQGGLENLSRRLQSSQSRYQAQKKKEETGQNSLEDLQNDNSRLRAELSKKTGESLQDFRKMYEAMVEVKGPSSFSSWETKGKKKGKKDAQPKSAGGTGGGDGKGGGKGDKGRGRGRKRGKGGGKSTKK